ncbi:sulfite exporter TauE/SafE family protein [Pedomonas sp. V897]|uniref:sulfite exporter TauE/SafE family protein n=1 Tax=Pedomonas sp. V897 TaxID=3446482 RepID=UPI003EDF7426
MDIYLPIAEMSVNAFVIIGFGAVVGFLSGMFGVGGGFLTTPLLIFYGIPPSVAVASAATQIAGSSVSGVRSHWRRGGVDPKMGGVLIVGGLVGSTLGSFIFKALKAVGQIDFIIQLLYVLILGVIGGLMLIESVGALVRARSGEAPPPARKRHHGLLHRLPWRMRFPRSGLYISPLAPLALGAGVGMLTAIMGVGGGFILVPAMIYLLGVSTSVVVGTSLFQIIFISAAVTVLHAINTQSVDILLAILLLVGGTVGAQLGAQFAQRLGGEKLRVALGLLVFLVSARLAVELMIRPSELFTVVEGLA